MINILTDKIIDYFKKNNIELSRTDLMKMKYALQVILGDFLKFVILFVIFLCFKKLDLFLLSLAVLITLRPFAGGIHCKTSISCLAITLLHFLAIVLLSNYLPRMNNIIYYSIYLISFIIFLIYVPCPNKKRPVKNKKILKIISLILLTFWSLFFFEESKMSFCNCIFLSILAQVVQVIFINKKECF